MGVLTWIAALATPLVWPTIMPPQVAVHIKGGHFDPGDYSWMRGSMPGATADQVKEWEAITFYRKQCQDNPTRDEAELASLGYSKVPAAYWRPYVPDFCRELAMAGWVTRGFNDWPSFSRALATAQPYYRTYLFAVSRAVEAAPLNQGDLRDQLNVAVVPDQMLRGAANWGQGGAAGAPPLDPDSLRVLTGMIWRPIHDQDHRNTEWIKGVLKKQGWPTISQVGKVAAGNAWLLVQHADDDPIFQLRVLKLMEPLVATKEVDGENYALLYDRVMLPLTGKQRYGSQFVCQNNQWSPSPLEDPANVDKHRAAVGLKPLADYMKTLVADYGENCGR